MNVIVNKSRWEVFIAIDKKSINKSGSDLKHNNAFLPLYKVQAMADDQNPKAE